MYLYCNGYTSGGNAPPIVNTIDKFFFSTDANATDVGDLTQARRLVAGQSSSEFGYTSGGHPRIDTIDKFPFSTDANSTDVGDLTQARGYGAGQSSGIFGYLTGGSPTGGNIIENFHLVQTPMQQMWVILHKQGRRARDIKFNVNTNLINRIKYKGRVHDHNS